MTTVLARDDDDRTIDPRGPFSLREAALFGFGQRHEDRFDGTFRLGFVDGTSSRSGRPEQDADGSCTCS